MIKVCVFVAQNLFCSTGQIGYAIVPMIARGIMLGPDQPVILHLLDTEQTNEALNSLKMELLGSAFPLLKRMPLICESYTEVDRIILSLKVS